MHRVLLTIVVLQPQMHEFLDLRLIADVAEACLCLERRQQVFRHLDTDEARSAALRTMETPEIIQKPHDFLV